MRYLTLLIILTLLLILLTGCTTAPTVDLIDANAQAAVTIGYASMGCDRPTPAPRPEPKPDTGKKPETSVLDRPKPTDYRTALAKYQQGRPMVVIVGAQWCAPCQKMKSELRAHIDAGVFDGHELALVDYDGEQELATKIAGTSRVSLPTIRLYWRDGEAKKTKVHVGYMGREQFQEFIRR